MGQKGLLTVLRHGCRMSRYRRLYVLGGTYFFTVNLAQRGSDVLIRRVDVLREAVRVTRAARPFAIEAWVVMPDHLHAVWTLPPGDADFSVRWKEIKGVFSQACPVQPHVSPSKARKGERGIWQRRFWEHCIRDEADFAAHVAYCHWNPVKHGFVERPENWAWSSVHREIRRERWT